MKINTNSKKIKETLTRGVEVVYPTLKALEKKMKTGRIKLYCGYDPSAPTLHIGHMITLKKLAQFQELGHEVIMLLGDFTGMIGDPTEKLSSRKKLSRKEVLSNSKNYKKYASKMLKFHGPNPAKILYNSKWSDKLAFTDLIELASNFTVQQMIIRDMFQERIKNKKPIYLHEFLYPLAQAYDSLVMNVDLEVGGKDQTFNMLCGRSLMKALKKKEKFVLSTRLLLDSAGKKMGKTEGNVVKMDDSPREIYGKVMSWTDSLITTGFELCTDLPSEEIKKISEQIKKGKLNPRVAKSRLAVEIASVCHNKEQAKKAEEEFNKVFRDKGVPSAINKVKLPKISLRVLDIVTKTGLVSSNGEARRLIIYGGVKINNKIEKDWGKKIKIKKGLIVQVGKRRFAEIN